MPQGSHLGPILFLVFINDLEASVGATCSTDIYADDTILHRSVARPIDGSGVALQEGITAAGTWASSWHGQFGHPKTKLYQSARRQAIVWT